MAISKIILNGEVQMDVTSDTVTAGSMLSGTIATKNDGTKATGTIASKSSSDLTASGATVTAPAGYYSANASKSVTTMTLPTTTSTSATSGYVSKATIDRSTSDRYLNIAPGYNSTGGYYKINKVANGSVTAPSSISGTSATVSTGTNTLTLTKSISVTPNVTTAGYISSGTAGSSSVSLTASVTTKAATTITPSTSAQEVAAGTYLTGKLTISAMPSGIAGTPTATKGTVSNHSVTVTPSVTNTTGYITGGTKTGTAVTVSASELASGNKAITENGTNIDVVGYSTVSVDVPSSGGGSVTWETIYDGNVYIVSDSPNYVAINNWAPTHPTFEDGQTWRVTWNGTKYVCPVKVRQETVYIGNAQIVGYSDTSSEPFFAYMRTSTQLSFATTDSAGSITLKMELQHISGDFSTATVTITNNNEGPISASGIPAIIEAGDLGSGSPATIYMMNDMPSGTRSYTVPLYKGSVTIWNYFYVGNSSGGDDYYGTTVSGNAQTMGEIIQITGDCAITILTQII